MQPNTPSHGPVLIWSFGRYHNIVADLAREADPWAQRDYAASLRKLARTCDTVRAGQGESVLEAQVEAGIEVRPAGARGAPGRQARCMHGGMAQWLMHVACVLWRDAPGMRARGLALLEPWKAESFQ